MLWRWASDAGIDFTPDAEFVGNESFVSNQEWELVSFRTQKLLLNYSCCPAPFSEIRMHLVIYRKSLYYLVNLVIPQAIISMVATIGFFTPSTTTSQRSEKVHSRNLTHSTKPSCTYEVNLGITTLLAMAILLLMVSDKMPTTSNYVPLISSLLISFPLEW